MDVDTATYVDYALPATDNAVPHNSDFTTQHSIDIGEDESICKPDNEENLQLSIQYNGIDVYEACIDTLKPQFCWSK